MRKGIIPVLLFLSITLNAQVTRIKLGDAETTSIKIWKPSVNINRHDNLKVMIAGLGDGVYSSEDAGVTWQSKKLPFNNSPAGPVQLISAKKNVVQMVFPSKSIEGEQVSGFFASETNDNGASWKSEYFVLPNHSGQILSPNIGRNMRTNDLYLSWVGLSEIENSGTESKSNIYFTGTSNLKKWSAPEKVNQYEGMEIPAYKKLYSVTFDVTLLGRAFISYAYDNAIYMDRSYDKGKTWLSRDIKVSEIEGGMQFALPGTSPVFAEPLLKTNNSGSVFSGYIYVIWSDLRNGADNSDVFVVKSTQNGDVWTWPEKVNQDDSGRHQFKPAVVIDEANGIICVAYYDQRDTSDKEFDIYLSYSVDGGGSFKDLKLNDVVIAHIPEFSESMDLGMDMYKGKLVVAWNQFELNQSVSLRAAIVDFAEILKK